jgi:1-acyl-sn-glycerol-3-phosphate acyltransferase
MEFIRLARAVVRPLLRAISYIDIVGLENIPETGTAIVASNHLGRLDALLAVILSDREDFVIMVAEKYQKIWFWRWVMGELDALWLNRYEADFQTLKTVIKRMKSGQILGIAPEGTRSKTEALLAAKEGTAYLAVKTNAAVIPIAVWGTEDRAVVQRLLHFRKLIVHVRIGEPYTLPPMPRGKDRAIFLSDQTDELMCHIAAMLPPKYRGYYANHPRVPELVTEMLKNGMVVTQS